MSNKKRTTSETDNFFNSLMTYNIVSAVVDGIITIIAALLGFGGKKR